MDVAAGDLDTEANGNELDGSGAAEEDTPQLNSMAEYFGNPEDAEEDDEDCGHDEGEPDYRKRRRHRQNEGGPGCAISDSDYYGGEKPGESENAASTRVWDQSGFRAVTRTYALSLSSSEISPVKLRLGRAFLCRWLKQGFDPIAILRVQWNYIELNH